MEHVWAYTGTDHRPGEYVGYVNLSKADGGVAVTVRGQGEKAVTAQHVVPDSELRSLYNSIGRYLLDKQQALSTDKA